SVRLDLRVRKLDAETDAQAVAAGRVERHCPHRRQVETAGTALHVAPVAADVQDVHEGQAGECLHRRFQARLAAAHGQRRPVLLPGVTDESGAEVADGGGRRRGGGDGVPALVLLDAEWTLVETIRDRRSGNVVGTIGAQTGEQG